MGDFIAEISITEFKKLKAPQLRRLQSCEVYSDGEYLFTFLNGSAEDTGYVRTQADYLGERGNSVGGESLEEILSKEVAVA